MSSERCHLRCKMRAVNDRDLRARQAKKLTRLLGHSPLPSLASPILLLTSSSYKSQCVSRISDELITKTLAFGSSAGGPKRGHEAQRSEESQACSFAGRGEEEAFASIEALETVALDVLAEFFFGGRSNRWEVLANSDRRS